MKKMHYFKTLFIVCALLVATPGAALAQEAQSTDVFRFWSSAYKHHFYTISQRERDLIQQNDPNWAYEGVAYKAYVSAEENTKPIFRFWSERFKSHFYTSSVDERDNVIQNDPNWVYEGIAYYTRTQGQPVYRFYSKLFNGHFYTTSEVERTRLIEEDPNWTYEGVVFYAADTVAGITEPDDTDDTVETPIATTFCGSEDGQTLSAPPTGELCTNGTVATEQTGSGPWQWACANENGEIVSLCKALSTQTNEVVVGECGTVLNTCASGTFIETQDSSSQYLWGCYGSGGYETFDSCSLLK